MARRHLARERATPSAPNVNSMMHSYQGTLSSEMPWTANCNQCVVCQVGSTISRVSSSSSMSRWYAAHCPGLPLEHSSPPQLMIHCHCPLTALRSKPVYAGFGNHLPMPHLDQVRPGLSPHQSGWTRHGGNVDHRGHFGHCANVIGYNGAAGTPCSGTGE